MTTTYTFTGLQNHETALRSALAADHRGKECKVGAVITWSPFSIIVHDKGASMIIAGKCNKGHWINRSEAL